jgi:hypothetical protein
LRRWWAPRSATSGTSAIAAAPTSSSVATPAVSAAARRIGTASGRPDAPMTACRPRFQMPAFSPAIASSVSPSIASWS